MINVKVTRSYVRIGAVVLIDVVNSFGTPGNGMISHNWSGCKLKDNKILREWHWVDKNVDDGMFDVLRLLGFCIRLDYYFVYFLLARTVGYRT